MSCPQAFTLLKDRFDHKAGTVVFKTRCWDYGLSNDDTRGTGVEHTSVTLDPEGGYPTFTVPVTDIEEFN